MSSQEHLPDPTIDQIRDIAQDTLNEWLAGYQSVMNDDSRFGLGLQFRQMADGVWYVDDSDGVRAKGARGMYRITVAVERIDGPESSTCPTCGS